jgi:hypothetical protein
MEKLFPPPPSLKKLLKVLKTIGLILFRGRIAIYRDVWGEYRVFM